MCSSVLLLFFYYYKCYIVKQQSGFLGKKTSLRLSEILLLQTHNIT